MSASAVLANGRYSYAYMCVCVHLRNENELNFANIFLWRIATAMFFRIIEIHRARTDSIREAAAADYFLVKKNKPFT